MAISVQSGANIASRASRVPVYSLDQGDVRSSEPITPPRLAADHAGLRLQVVAELQQRAEIDAAPPLYLLERAAPERFRAIIVATLVPDAEDERVRSLIHRACRLPRAVPGPARHMPIGASPWPGSQTAPAAVEQHPNTAASQGSPAPYVDPAGYC